jgi:hypothetical protein
MAAANSWKDDLGDRMWRNGGLASRFFFLESTLIAAHLQVTAQ